MYSGLVPNVLFWSASESCQRWSARQIVVLCLANTRDYEEDFPRVLEMDKTTTTSLGVLGLQEKFEGRYSCGSEVST